MENLLVVDTAMKDGLYRVATKYLCAGFVVENNKVIMCAPILKKKFSYWKTVAKKMETKNERRKISRSS